VDYERGYKDGRSKKANLARSGAYGGNATAYLEGFADGKAKKARRM